MIWDICVRLSRITGFSVLRPSLAKTQVEQSIRRAAAREVNEMKLVAKPDQLVKRRGKLGLVAVNMSAPALLDIESGNCREFPQQDRLFRSQMCASGSW